MNKKRRHKIREKLIEHIRTAPFEQIEKELKAAGLDEYAEAKAGQHEKIVIGKYELLPHGYEINDNDECLLDDTETWVRVEKWMVGMENSNAFNPIRRISQ